MPGEEAYRLYDTFGLPLDLVEELAGEHDVTVERAGFDKALAQQQERARQASRMGAVKGDPVYMELLEGGKTDFLGYNQLRIETARVLAVLKDGALVRRLDAGQEGAILLDRTPFYAMGGGQVGDHGVIASDGSAAEVSDTTAPVPGLYLHHVRGNDGGFERGMTVSAQADEQRRSQAMRHHTGTHLLQPALRDSLAPHRKQSGRLEAREP